MIQTTMNIDRELADRLFNVSKNSGISISSISEMLFKRISPSAGRRIASFRRVRYQRRSKNPCWHCLHVSLSFQVYEKCLDFRKIYKISVSALLSEEIKNNLSLLLRDFLLKRRPDIGSDIYIVLYDDNHNYHVFNDYHEDKLLLLT